MLCQETVMMMYRSMAVTAKPEVTSPSWVSGWRALSQSIPPEIDMKRVNMASSERRQFASPFRKQMRES